MSFLDGADRNQVCLIDTGIYTGDGAVSQAITGIGFQPKFVWVTHNPAVETNYAGVDLPWYVAWDTMTAGLSLMGDHDVKDNRLISLDADGFTVDDDGGDTHPNKDGQPYAYIALG